MKKINTLLLLLGMVLLVYGCSQTDQTVPTEEPETQTPELIKIGFMAPLSGDAASYGEIILGGVMASLEDNNAGSLVEIVVEDSKCDPKDAVSAVNKLISVDNVQVIIGEVCSSATLAAAPIARENGVAMISAASTSPLISNFPEVFRTVPSDEFQGAFGAMTAFERGFTKMAILHGNEDYGIGFKNVLEENFVAQGGTVAIVETFERGDTDLKTQLTKIKESDADVIYIISNSPDSSTAALKQAEELNLNIPLMASEGLKEDELLTRVGSAAEGMILTSVSQGEPAFVENWVRKTGEEPGPFAAQGHDAFTAITLSMEQGARTKEDFLNVLRDVQFSGVSGEIAFDANGDVEGSYEVYVVRDGSFVKEQ